MVTALILAAGALLAIIAVAVLEFFVFAARPRHRKP